MGKDKKKKGKGMEKTLAKTEKKLDKVLKKELKEIGEVITFFRIILRSLSTSNTSDVLYKIV